MTDLMKMLDRAMFETEFKEKTAEEPEFLFTDTSRTDCSKPNPSAPPGMSFAELEAKLAAADPETDAIVKARQAELDACTTPQQRSLVKNKYLGLLYGMRKPRLNKALAK